MDDDPSMGRMIGQALSPLGVEAVVTSSVPEAVVRFDAEDFDVVVTDLRMTGGSGLELCAHVVRARDDVPVIVATAFGSMQTAVEALRSGAFDFVTKPFDLDVLRAAVLRAIERRRLQLRVRRLEVELDAARGAGPLLGRSPAMNALQELVDRVADSTATVLVTGESGTGKSLVAREIHRASGRAGRFVEVSCGALAESLLESELFGHVAGAFTGATADRAGRFVLADEGTIFLDEIATASPALQVKLLRVLQERRLEPVGGVETRSIDARVVLATHEDLPALVAAGRFRADLFWRINVVAIEMPALRDRASDIPALADHFLRAAADQAGRVVEGFTPAALEALVAHAWPGNVRELEHAVGRAVFLGHGPLVDVADLPAGVTAGGPARVPPAAPLKRALAAPERQLILDALERNGWRRDAAARALGINRTTLYKKLKRLGLDLTALEPAR